MSLVVQNLVKSFAKHKVVDSISFNVSEGEIFGLVGPNGAGKSTTISMLCGLLSPDSGEIYFMGTNINNNLELVKREMGLVPQEIALYAGLTAKENLQFWGRMYGLRGRYLESRVNEALEVAGLKDRANEIIENYSGGMKRRINIAASMLHRPKLLIMDEPTVGVDPQSRNHILEAVRNLNRQGVTVIYTSHYMEEVESVCTKAAIMDKGKILAQGTLKELANAAGNLESLEIELGQAPLQLAGQLENLAPVERVEVMGNRVKITAPDGPTALTKVLSLCEINGLEVIDVKINRPNLENVFLMLTGRSLRN